MRRFLIFLIRSYQAVSRSGAATPFWMGGISGCRFWPTCSEHAIEAIERHGVVKGGFRACARVLQCNPLFSALSHQQ